MSAAVSAKATELPESRVRVEAEVPSDVVDQRLDQVARELGRDMKMPGFRKGKVPAQVVMQRLGRETVLDEAIRSTLGRWYLQAVDAAKIHPVGDPDLSLGDLPGAGDPFTFSFEIGVRPTATLGTYKGLEVGRREPEADEEAVTGQLDELRTRMAKLETVEEPAAEGDFVVMDYVGSIDGEEFEGGAGTDQLIELGSGRLIPGFEEQLTGATAGEDRTLNVSFPDDYQAEHLAGQDAQFAVTVKEIRRRILPELDDDFASDAAGFDTLDELREDISTRLKEMDEQRADGEYREAVLDAVVEQATVTVPPALIEARGRELLDRMLHQLEHQGINRDMYFQISGRTEEDLLAESAEDAERTLKREAVLAAIIDAEGIEPSDGDVLDALQASAASENTTPEKLRDRLEKAGRLDDLLDDLAQRAALDLIVEHATAIDPERAAARDKLWTPDKD
jgi:trigger factor